MSETMLIGLMMVAMELAIVAVLSFGLHYFVALNSPPSSRAAWTAGLAYLITSIIFAFGFIPGYEMLAPVAALPGGFLAFWFWRAEFRRGWIEDPGLAPEGATIANDDWRIGLIQLLGLIAAGAAAAIARQTF